MNKDLLSLNVPNSSTESIEAKSSELIKNLKKIFANPSSIFGYEYDISCLLDEMGISVDLYFNFLLYRLSNNFKKNEGSELILGYLFLMKDFITMFKKLNDSHYKEYLEVIAKYLNYEKVEKNEVVMRFGDKGKQAYIILNGTIDILIKSMKKMKTTENDYLIYIGALIYYKEYGLINEVINENYMICPLEIIDDITEQNDQNKQNQHRLSFRDTNENFNKIELFQLNGKNVSFKAQNSKLVKTYTASSLIKTFLMERHLIDERKKKSNYDNSSLFNKNSQRNNSLIKLANFDPLDCVSTNEYIHRFNIIRDLTDIIPEGVLQYKNTSILSLNIFTYIKITSGTTGTVFGELALSDPQALRTATIITSTDCHFGTLNKSVYNLSLKAGTDKLQRNTIEFILSYEIFKDVGADVLSKKYFTNFSKQTCSKGTFLFNQNTPSKCLCFLREGVYTLSTKMNFNELCAMTKLLYSKRNGYNHYVYEIEEKEKAYKRMMNTNIPFKKFYYERHTFTICEIDCPELIGLDAYINKDGNLAFDVVCRSPKGEYLQLNNNFYDIIKERTENVQSNEINHLQKKYTLFSDRINTIYKSEIQSFLDRETKKDYKGLIVSTQNDLFQKELEKRRKTLLNEKINIKMLKTANKEEKDFQSVRDFNSNNNNTKIPSLFKDKVWQVNRKRSDNSNKSSQMNSFQLNKNSNSTYKESSHLLLKPINIISTDTNKKEISTHMKNCKISDELTYLLNSSINNSTYDKDSSIIQFNDMIWENIKPRTKLPLLVNSIQLHYKNFPKKKILSHSSKTRNINIYNDMTFKNQNVKMNLNKANIKTEKDNDIKKNVNYLICENKEVDIEKNINMKRERYTEKRKRYVNKTLKRMQCLMGSYIKKC